MKAPQGHSAPEPVGAGSHHGICYMVVDLGTHHGTWEGKPIVKRQVQLGFEVPAARIEVDGKDLPRVLRAWYTFSMYKQAPLCKNIEKWRGKVFTSQEEADEFDLKTLLGKNAIVSSVINKNGYDKVEGLGCLMAGMQEKQAENDFLYYSIDEHGLNIPEGMYDKIVAKIKDSDEYKELLNPTTQGAMNPSQQKEYNEAAPKDDDNPPPPTEDPRDFSDGDPDANVPTGDDIPF